MKVYYVQPSDIGIAQFADTTLRPSGVEEVAHHTEADLCWCPTSLWGMRSTPELAYRIANAFSAPERVVYSDCSDLDVTYDLRRSLMIRANCRSWMRDTAPFTQPFAWPIEPEWGRIADEEAIFTTDVAFVGWSREPTQLACNSIRSISGLSFQLVERNHFWGYWPAGDPQALQERAEMEDSVRHARLNLSAESISGTIRYRTLEIMCAARVPLVFASASCVWPFADDWRREDCMFVYPIEDAPQAGEIVKRLLAEHDDSDLREMGRRGREIWSKWMDRRKFGDLARILAERHLDKLQR